MGANFVQHKDGRAGTTQTPNAAFNSNVNAAILNEVIDECEAEISEPLRLLSEIRDLRMLPSLFQAIIFGCHLIVSPTVVKAPANDCTIAVVRNRNRATNNCPMCHSSASPGR